MRFTTDDKHIIKWMWVKKICRKKTLAQDAWSLDVLQRHWSKYQCEIFNFVDLCSGVGIVWLTTTQTWVNDVAAVTFSFKCFNTLKLSSRKHLQKVVCFIHFIYSQAFNNNVIFNSKSYSKNTFTDVRFTSLLANDIYRVTTLQTMWNSLTIPWHFPDSSSHSSAAPVMLSVTHIMPVLVLLSVVGVGMQQCMIRNHIFNF